MQPGLILVLAQLLVEVAPTVLVELAGYCVALRQVQMIQKMRRFAVVRSNSENPPPRVQLQNLGIRNFKQS